MTADKQIGLDPKENMVNVYYSMDEIEKLIQMSQITFQISIRLLSSMFLKIHLMENKVSGKGKRLLFADLRMQMVP